MIYAQPGSTFATVLEGAPTGLAGTIGVRIENPDGSNHTPRASAGIVELEAGSGAYAKSDLVAPSTAGTYIVLWDTGGSSPTFATEELRVTYTAPVPGPATVTLAELKAHANIARGDDDAQLQKVLDAAVAFAVQRTGRQLHPLDQSQVAVHPAGRRFVRVPDASEITAVDADGVEIDGYRLHDHNGYTTHVELPHRRYGYRPPDQVTVTGTFGMDPLPDELRLAIIEEATNRWYDRAAGNATSAGSEEYGDISYSRPPGWARAVFKSFRVPSDDLALA